MPLVTAHRGASAAHPPGNTVAAFHAAATLGADWVELDARPASDGTLVVHHDAGLPDGREIAATAPAELPTWVPTLAEALDACGDLGVNVELKPDSPATLRRSMVSAAVGELRARGGRDRWLLTSFDWSLVDEARREAPELPTGLLVVDPGVGPDPVAAATAGGHRAVNPWVGALDAELVARAHGAGLRVNTWTVDDPVQIAVVAALGVDGIITDLPDLARRVLAGEGLSEG